ncbi:hypothetical protein B0H16DRAFT_1727649 [Mycena metata]|uniref:Uncharacterized protein n=1 Tax=Mycena metata TaxID=1033252 RepID=A0AAD7IKT1_9AGAR|nr:hypothetical protein B0H16DRAFT_1727649 [Mycena metata]
MALRDVLDPALVCRAFAYAAQSRIFRSIALVANPIKPMVAASLRLSSDVRNSPHLGSLIRSLVIGVHRDILEQVLSMELPQLRSIHFVVELNPPGAVLIVSETTVDVMFAVLAAFPTVSSISLSFLTFRSPRVFERIVRCFGSGVQTLALQRICILRGAPHQTSPPPIVCPQITRLKLISCAAAVSEKLSAPSCPLDLQNLVDVTFTGPMSPAFIELLKSSQSTITRLTFEHFVGNQDLAFPLPALTHLSFDAVWILALAVVVQSPSHSPGLPSLREISLTVTDLDAPSLPQHAG